MLELDRKVRLKKNTPYGQSSQVEMDLVRWIKVDGAIHWVCKVPGCSILIEYPEQALKYSNPRYYEQYWGKNARLYRRPKGRAVAD